MFENTMRYGGRGISGAATPGRFTTRGPQFDVGGLSRVAQALQPYFDPKIMADLTGGFGDFSAQMQEGIEGQTNVRTSYDTMESVLKDTFQEISGRPSGSTAEPIHVKVIGGITSTTGAPKAADNMTPAPSPRTTPDAPRGAPATPTAPVTSTTGTQPIQGYNATQQIRIEGDERRRVQRSQEVEEYSEERRQTRIRHEHQKARDEYYSNLPEEGFKVRDYTVPYERQEPENKPAEYKPAATSPPVEAPGTSADKLFEVGREIGEGIDLKVPQISIDVKSDDPVPTAPVQTSSVPAPAAAQTKPPPPDDTAAKSDYIMEFASAMSSNFKQFGVFLGEQIKTSTQDLQQIIPTQTLSVLGTHTASVDPVGDVTKAETKLGRDAQTERTNRGIENVGQHLYEGFNDLISANNALPAALGGVEEKIDTDRIVAKAEKPLEPAGFVKIAETEIKKENRRDQANEMFGKLNLTLSEVKSSSTSLIATASGLRAPKPETTKPTPQDVHVDFPEWPEDMYRKEALGGSGVKDYRPQITDQEEADRRTKIMQVASSEQMQKRLAGAYSDFTSALEKADPRQARGRLPEQDYLTKLERESEIARAERTGATGNLTDIQQRRADQEEQSRKLVAMLSKTKDTDTYQGYLSKLDVSAGTVVEEEQKRTDVPMSDLLPTAGLVANLVSIHRLLFIGITPGDRVAKPPRPRLFRFATGFIVPGMLPVRSERHLQRYRMMGISIIFDVGDRR